MLAPDESLCRAMEIDRHNRTKSLVSLPNELIIEIAEYVAPNGGLKAANFRLLCRRTAFVLAGVVWSAVIFPRDAFQLHFICTALLDENHSQHRSFITSIRYDVPALSLDLPLLVFGVLPRLKRLSLVGQTGTTASLGAHAMELLGRLSLTTLEMAYIDLTQARSLHEFAPRVRNVGVASCPNSYRCFVDDDQTITSRLLVLESLEYRPYFNGNPEQNTNDILAALLSAVGPTIREVKLHWGGAAPCLNESFLYGWSADLTDPWALHIVVPQRLFDLHPRGAQDASTFIRALNWAGANALGSLTLSISPETTVFNVRDTFRELSLPTLHTLALSFKRQDQGFYFPRPDTISIGAPHAFRNLVKLLTSASLPSLKTVSLVGWLDATSVSAFLGWPISSVAAMDPLVFALLGVLRGMGVQELRLRNAKGHSWEGKSCVFRREEEGDWEGGVLEEEE